MVASEERVKPPELVKNAAPGSNPVQPLGNREVFFNDTEHVGGTPIAKGDKKYMRCKKLGAPTKAVKPVESSPLKEKSAKNTKNISDHILEYTSTQVQTNGTMYYLSGFLSLAAIGIGIYAGLNMFFIGSYIIDFSQNIPGYIYRFIMFFVMFFYNYIIYPLTKKPEEV